MTDGNYYSLNEFGAIGYRFMSRFRIQSITSVLAIWISFIMPLNARDGHSVAIWEIVCILFPQSHKRVVYNFHLYIMWLHLPWPVLMRFRVTQICLGRSKPGCLKVGLVTMFCPSGFSAIQSSCHLVFHPVFSSNSISAVFQDGLRDLRRSLSTFSLTSACIGRFLLLLI
jgi:hypothetical protein